MRSPGRKLLALLLLGGLLGCAAPASAAVVTDSVVHVRFGIVPAFGAQGAHQTSCDSNDCSGLTWHGGPVQHAESDYLFFWDPSGYTLPASYITGMQTWLSDVASADGTNGNPFSANTQYYDHSGAGGTNSYVPYSVANAGTINDTDAYPSSDCTDHAYGSASNFPVCLTEAQIISELSSYITAQSLPTGPDVEYFVLTPQNVGSCFDNTSSSCAYTAYCGWHSYSGSGSTQIVFADMPWAYNVSGCDVNGAFGAGYANPNYVDPVVSVFSHELSETMTDPNLNAWYDSSGNENGDKCAYIYGSGGYGYMTGLNYNGSGYWNVPLNGDHYLLQQEFDNVIDNCVMSLTTTWTGSASATGWSTGTNWDGQLAPLSAVDTLSFPALGGGCVTCYTTNNDAIGLSAYRLTVDDGVGYSVSGNSVTLGAGGLSATTSAGSPVASTLSLPLTLGANQTWTIDGGALNVNGALSGPAGTSLSARLSNGGTLGFGADYEIGPVSVVGTNGADTGANASQNGTASFTSLNAVDGSSVSLADAALATPTAPAAIGALTSTGGSLQVGAGGQASTGTLSVNGAVTLDSASELKLFVDSAGTSPGTDFSQLNATGNVALGGTLDLVGAPGGGGCPSLSQGDVDTLITTTGTLSGTFAGIPDGSDIVLSCTGSAPYVRINYTANSVTATVTSLSAPADVTVPAISGQTIQGQTLSEAHGSWTNSPTGYSYQWEDCDSSGANCSAILGATGTQYVLAAGDIGHTIRVQETASNTAGTSSAASSHQTALVSAPAGGGGSGGGTTSGGSGGGTTSGGSGGGGTSGPTAGEVAFDVRNLLSSRGSGGYTYSFIPRAGGTLVVSWYYQPKPVHRRGKRTVKPKPVLIATIRVTIPRSGRYTVRVGLTKAGRRLLRHAKRIRLTAVATYTTSGLPAITARRTFVLVR